MKLFAALLVVLGALSTGCAAHAEPIEADAVVLRAGAASPIHEGDHCLLRMQPAWRQGVNCQVVLSCGDEDLFGGRRIGGYAVCETFDGTFTTANDGERRSDGDPAIHVDLTALTIEWEGPIDAETAELRIEAPLRPTPSWE